MQEVTGYGRRPDLIKKGRGRTRISWTGMSWTGMSKKTRVKFREKSPPEKDIGVSLQRKRKK